MAMKMTKEQQQLATIFRFLHNVLSMSPVSKKTFFLRRIFRGYL